MTANVQDPTAAVEAWLQAVADGDEAQFDALYDWYRPTLTRFARRHGADDPEGAVDLALYDGFRAIDRIRHLNDATFSAYLYRAVLGRMGNQREKVIPDPVFIDGHGDHPSALVAESFEVKLTEAQELASLVDLLPEDQRDVIKLRYFEDRTGQETGALLGKNANAVYQLQHRAIRNLRRLLLIATALAVALVGAVALLDRSGRTVIDSTPADPTIEERVDRSEAPDETVAPSPTVADEIPSPPIEGVEELGAPDGEAVGVVADGPVVTAPPSPTTTSGVLGAPEIDSAAADSAESDGGESPASPAQPTTTDPPQAGSTAGPPTSAPLATIRLGSVRTTGFGSCFYDSSSLIRFFYTGERAEAEAFEVPISITHPSDPSKNLAAEAGWLRLRTSPEGAASWSISATPADARTGAPAFYWGVPSGLDVPGATGAQAFTVTYPDGSVQLTCTGS